MAGDSTSALAPSSQVPWWQGGIRVDTVLAMLSSTAGMVALLLLGFSRPTVPVICSVHVPSRTLVFSRLRLFRCPQPCRLPAPPSPPCGPAQTAEHPCGMMQVVPYCRALGHAPQGQVGPPLPPPPCGSQRSWTLRITGTGVAKGTSVPAPTWEPLCCLLTLQDSGFT